MPGNQPKAASPVVFHRAAAVFRRTADVTEAQAMDASFVSYLRERVGKRLCAVVEYDEGRPTVSYRRDDFEFEVPDGGQLLDGLRTDRRCVVAARESAVWLSLERVDGRVLVVADSQGSRDLTSLVADCRTALDANDADRSPA